MKMGLLEISR